MADFAHQAGMDLIQLLPINDTTTFMDWRDSYPYRAISVFALHPIYINLHDFWEDLTDRQQSDLLKEEKELNLLEQIDYERVLDLKWNYIKLLYDKKAKKIQASDAYLKFINKNSLWLEPYACFCVLRNQEKSADFSKWVDKTYSEKVYAKLKANESTDVELELQFFMQYFLHQQLKAAIDYCHQLGVAVKGDIAIGIAHDSVDAWTNPELFNLNMQAGAPPDVFAVNGQNWGFPTYNWERMAEDNYSWWKRRMQAMSEYFDAYRLDHILGFFRIWEIPQESVRGLLGQFSPALALSAEEIERSYGIPLRQWGVERFTKPFIKDWVIDDIFGRDYRDQIIQKYLKYTGFGNYAFDQAYDNQRKIEAAHIDEWIRLGLYQLHENVIFVQDHKNPELFHPRISVQNTISFQEFGAEYQERIKRLYNDYFYGRNYNFWKDRAYEKLPVIKDSTEMLACGEDLGMVPDNVPDVMYRLQILRLIVERMPNDDHFMNPLEYAPYLSVVTTSSHDTSNLRAWWTEDAETTQRYYNEIMGWQGPAPSVASARL
ncbi:4-alpha-glucanotransferase [Lactococcus fujiensis]|uniref:4-alpha-glucanotransferase n=1 Tax=Lactococcus fujiensis TaxID=610251 RepID=UPI000B2B0A9E|nr:4-alpha-glucanotransferase [Lactococcus fujiensis]